MDARVLAWTWLPSSISWLSLTSEISRFPVAGLVAQPTSSAQPRQRVRLARIMDGFLRLPGDDRLGVALHRIKALYFRGDHRIATHRTKGPRSCCADSLLPCVSPAALRLTAAPPRRSPSRSSWCATPRKDLRFPIPPSRRRGSTGRQSWLAP